MVDSEEDFISHHCKRKFHNFCDETYPIMGTTLVCSCDCHVVATATVEF